MTAASLCKTLLVLCILLHGTYSVRDGLVHTVIFASEVRFVILECGWKFHSKIECSPFPLVLCLPSFCSAC